MNIQGSGLTSYNSTYSNEMRLFQGGLKNMTMNSTRLEQGKMNHFHDSHDFLNYERGTICRSRSPNNQFLDFQTMYGGFRMHVGQR